MLYWLGENFHHYFGPLRLLNSYLLLAGLSTAIAAFLTWWLLPKWWPKLPRDQGRAHAVGSVQSVGKPMGAGILFVPIFLIVALITVPFEPRTFEFLPCVILALLVGYGDDRSKAKGGGWHEYKLGLFDLIISLMAAAILCQLRPIPIWLPVVKSVITLSPWLYIPLASVFIWVSINATNCTDGVDGLSGSLCGLTFFYLGIILYGIVGHAPIANYLLVPHYADGASWGLLGFTMTGCLAGYVWHNSPPSAVLMGDAGSRPMGLMLGVLVLATGNPFLIFVLAGVVLVNGATGLVKVALLRFLKIRIFSNVRYPLHDHARHKYGWSNAQVLVRFTILQALLAPLLLMLILKVR